MCKWGTDREVTIRRRVAVDACIADFVVWLNEQGVYTTGSCCGHDKDQPSFTIYPSSQQRAREMGFDVHLSERSDPCFTVDHGEIARRMTRPRLPALEPLACGSCGGTRWPVTQP